MASRCRIVRILKDLFRHANGLASSLACACQVVIKKICGAATKTFKTCRGQQGLNVDMTFRDPVSYSMDYFVGTWGLGNPNGGPKRNQTTRLAFAAS